MLPGGAVGIDLRETRPLGGAALEFPLDLLVGDRGE
jgi:hypothetical protein